jgi:hypothetical protein
MRAHVQQYQDTYSSMRTHIAVYGYIYSSMPAGLIQVCRCMTPLLLPDATCVSSYCYICVSSLPATYVSSYCYICVLILLYVCPHVCPHSSLPRGRIISAHYPFSLIEGLIEGCYSMSTLPFQPHSRPHRRLLFYEPLTDALF